MGAIQGHDDVASYGWLGDQDGSPVLVSRAVPLLCERKQQPSSSISMRTFGTGNEDFVALVTLAEEPISRTRRTTQRMEGQQGVETEPRSNQ
jgi:hypothetical protein